MTNFVATGDSDLFSDTAHPTARVGVPFSDRKLAVASVPYSCVMTAEKRYDHYNSIS